MFVYSLQPHHQLSPLPPPLLVPNTPAMWSHDHLSNHVIDTPLSHHLMEVSPSLSLPPSLPPSLPHTFTDKQHSLSPPPDIYKTTTSSGESPLVISHTPHPDHMTHSSSLYMKHVLSSTQFTREQLHHLFHVAHEMTVSRSLPMEGMKVSMISRGQTSQ